MAHQIAHLTVGLGRGRVVVVGSANVDQLFRVVAIPAPGETVLSTGFAVARGGKGQNQAVAAARAAASTVLVAALGDDGFGASTLAGLAEDGIDTSLVRRVDAATGTALIAVDDAGENTIIVEAGANALLAGLTEADAAAIRRADVLVMQLEIPLATVSSAAEIARDSTTIVLLNAAPIRELPDSLLRAVDILVVNEHEAAALVGDRTGGMVGLLELVPIVVVTLGSEGAVLHRAGLHGAAPTELRVPAHVVSAVDATGAGDTFCGAFAASLAEGEPLESALRFAVAAASLSVEAAGAVPSIPVRAAIDARLKSDPRG